MANYIANAFSLNMLADKNSIIVSSVVESHSLALTYLHGLASDGGVRSIVGHQETADIMSDLLGTPVEFNRESVSLNPGDVLLVGQYSGPRLPEGAKHLPEGANVVWLYVNVMDATKHVVATVNLDLRPHTYR